MTPLAKSDETAVGAFLAHHGWIVAIAVLLLGADPFQATWHDENYSAIVFVARGPSAILGDYHLPNNHIAFNLARWAWESVAGDGVLVSRLLPLGFSILAVIGVHAAARRIGGPRAAWIAALVFASSHSVAAFASQLRGYSMSLALVAGSLGFAAAWAARDLRGFGPAIGYALCGALAIATVPTNVLFVGAVGAWMLVGGGILRAGSRTAAAIAVAASPLLGFAAYAGAWPQFLAVAAGASGIDSTELLRSVLVDLLAVDLVVFYPSLLIWLLALRGDRPARLAMGLVACAALTLLVPLVGKAGFPRNYLPLAVPVSVAAGIWLDAVARRWPVPATLRSGAALAILLLAIAGSRELVLAIDEPRRWNEAGGRPQDLLDQYYRSPRYDPHAVVGAMAGPRPGDFVVVAEASSWDLAGFLLGRLGPGKFCAVAGDTLACTAEQIARGGTTDAIVVVHWDRRAADEVAALVAIALGTPVQAGEPLLDGDGHFRVVRYALAGTRTPGDGGHPTTSTRHGGASRRPAAADPGL